MVDIKFRREFAERMHSSYIDDVLENPNKFGAPTFEEFKMNRDKYMGREDDIFSKVDRGSEILKTRIKKYKFEVFENKCKTLEEAERLIVEYGYRPSQMQMCPELIPQNSYDCDMLVKFLPKDEYEKRSHY